MRPPSVAVLGGGLSGCATAYTLAREGFRDVTIVERAGRLGGLAGSFERAGRFYPLGYHHILHRDRALLCFLDLIGALPAVRWRRIRMLFHTGGVLHELGSVGGFLRFPMAASDKLRFARLMLRAARKRDWDDWHERSAADLVDAWSGPGVRRAIFEDLCRLKFELPCAEVSGAWLGSRLHFREGAAPLGYMPGTNWTTVLCDGVGRLLADAGVRVRTGEQVARLRTSGGAIREIELASGERLAADLFVSTVPTVVYLRLVPGDDTPHLASVRYTALLSVVCVTRQAVRPDFYWMNLASPGHTACGIFLLSSLNPTIGSPGDTCINFVTHLQDHTRPLFAEPDERLLARYHRDFRSVFGFDLAPFWSNVARVPTYSPILTPGFQNPPLRSTAWRNLYFAGNYRTFPSIVSTGTALASGVETGRAILEDHGGRSDLPATIAAFRLRHMPRG